MMKKNVKIKIGEKSLKIELERPELIYGIEGLLFNETINEKNAYIEPINKTVPIIPSNERRFFIPAHNQKDFEYAKKMNLKLTQVIAPYFLGIGDEKVREDMPTQKRHSVIAIIKHNKEEKYLCVDCKGRSCKSFVLGGIEDGESPEEAALREVKEETGYSDVTITGHSPYQLINHFYASYKGVNRYATLDILFGRINSEKNIGLSKEENNKHIVKWIEKDELKNFLTVNNNIFALNILLNGEKAYIGEGVLINSEKYNGISSKTARKQIEKILSE